MVQLLTFDVNPEAKPPIATRKEGLVVRQVGAALHVVSHVPVEDGQQLPGCCELVMPA